jgi:hypothetical protein
MRVNLLVSLVLLCSLLVVAPASASSAWEVDLSAPGPGSTNVVTGGGGVRLGAGGNRAAGLRSGFAVYSRRLASPANRFGVVVRSGVPAGGEVAIDVRGWVEPGVGWSGGGPDWAGGGAGQGSGPSGWHAGGERGWAGGSSGGSGWAGGRSEQGDGAPGQGDDASAQESGVSRQDGDAAVQEDGASVQEDRASGKGSGEPGKDGGAAGDEGGASRQDGGAPGKEDGASRQGVGAAGRVGGPQGRGGGRWTEWVEARAGAPAVLPVVVKEVEVRVMVAAAEGVASPVVEGLSVVPDTVLGGARDERVAGAGASYSVFATREGLVGGTTANGHRIGARDHFVALPSRRGLSARDGGEYSVRVCAANGRCAWAPVWGACCQDGT